MGPSALDCAMLLAVFPQAVHCVRTQPVMPAHTNLECGLNKKIFFHISSLQYTLELILECEQK